MSGAEELNELSMGQDGETPAQTVSARELRVCVVAGESSGDAHCAKLVAHLRELYPQSRIFGMGGSSLRAAGVETVVDCEASASLMGFTELLGGISKIIESFRTIVKVCESRNPELVILVDYPDFNLRLAKKLKKKGRKILYFISPQLWAWRSGRINQIKKYVDAVAPIFPFEETFYQQHGVRAEYVGHPFLDTPFPELNRKEFFSSIGADANRPAIALLPGSRSSEIQLLIPPMIAAWQIIKRNRPGVQAIIPLAPAVSLPDVKRLLPEERSDLFLVDGRAREVLVNCDLGVIASGTATVEAAIAGLPFVVVYRLSALSYWIARTLVRGVRFFAMPNLIAAKKIVPELLQSEVTGENIAYELERFFGDAGYCAKTKVALAKVRDKLRTGELAGKRAAKLAAELVEESTRPSSGRRWQRK
jgi:lipid-A-disaccharide synthase